MQFSPLKLNAGAQQKYFLQYQLYEHELYNTSYMSRVEGLSEASKKVEKTIRSVIGTYLLKTCCHKFSLFIPVCVQQHEKRKLLDCCLRTNLKQAACPGPSKTDHRYIDPIIEAEQNYFPRRHDKGTVAHQYVVTVLLVICCPSETSQTAGTGTDCWTDLHKMMLDQWCDGVLQLRPSLISKLHYDYTGEGKPATARKTCQGMVRHDSAQGHQPHARCTSPLALLQ